MEKAVNKLAAQGPGAPAAAKTGFNTKDTFQGVAPAAAPKAEAKPKTEDKGKGLDFLKDLPKLIGSFLKLFTGGGGGLGGIAKAIGSLFGLGGGGGGGQGGGGGGG
ncbi:MAG TPA: hypothetical protein VIG99_18140, partial [Myxococcaceae bacterium]